MRDICAATLLPLRRDRRHLDRAVRDGSKARPRQNRREKQRHCQHRHFHFTRPRESPLTSFASSRATSFASNGKLPSHTQDRFEVDAWQVGRSQIQASKKNIGFIRQFQEGVYIIFFVFGQDTNLQLKQPSLPPKKARPFPKPS